MRRCVVLAVLLVFISSACGDAPSGVFDAQGRGDADVVTTNSDTSATALLDSSLVADADANADTSVIDVTPDVLPPDPVHLCDGRTLIPWSKSEPEAGGTVTFNELMYHPQDLDELEWLELFNPMSVDIDISSWRLARGIDYTFPEGTFIRAGEHLVIAADPARLAQHTGFTQALGPFQGTLSNSGEQIELRNNRDRLMDAVDYEDNEPWPCAPDGSGATLAKRDAFAASGPLDSWTFSPQLLGTPGAPNFPRPSTTLTTLVGDDATWRAESSGVAPPTGWSAPDFDDSAWDTGVGHFYAGSADVEVTAQITADNHFAYYLGGPDGSDLRLVGRDTDGDWQSVEQFQAVAAPGEHVYIAAWEAVGDIDSTQMVIGQFDVSDGTSLVTRAASFEVVLGPTNANPGDVLTDPAPLESEITTAIQSANQASLWAIPQVERSAASAPWSFALATAFSGPASYLWIDTFDNNSQTNAQETWALFRSLDPIVSTDRANELPSGPITYYFRTTFDPGDVDTLQLDTLVDDGAAFYLNGVEVHRQNLLAGSLSASTLALQEVDPPVLTLDIPLDTADLVPGTNVLAAEVHVASINDLDMAFGAALRGRLSPPSSPPPTLAFHEVAAGASSPFWLELVNVSASDVLLADHVIRSSTGVEHTLAAQTLAPGELLMLDEQQLGFGAADSDRLFLLAPTQDILLDAVKVDVTVRARATPGAARWLYPDVATPGAANVLVLNDAVVINEIMYNPRAIDSPEWVELYNRSDAPVDLSGWQLVEGVRFEFAMGTTLEPQSHLVIASDAATMRGLWPGIAIVGDFDGRLDNSGEAVELRDACGNPVDRVPYFDDGRWPGWADGGGSSLERRSPWAASAAPESWAASEEGGRASWQTVTYRGAAQPSSANDPQWSEFVLGLLDAGVVLLDDVSVIQDPDGAALELIENGGFDTDLSSGWRILGDHLGEVVADPENPSNRVLRLEATGPTEHMHNHAETTLVGVPSVTNGATYQISFRARWVAGSRLLNTRLYFNRLARSTPLDVPTLHGTPGARNSAWVDNLGPTFSGLRHTPAVPQAAEPVTVEVSAVDPDGVERVTLYRSVDGAPFVATPMTDQGAGRHTAEVSGDAAASVVQFYVEAVDLTGVTSTSPPGGAEARALWKVDEGAATDGALRNLRIIMTQADQDTLHAEVNLMSNRHLGATVISDERDIFYDVGVRLKGSERGRPTTIRLGYGLYFHRDQPFRGVYRSVLVDRSEGVGFGQREMLINQVLAHAGATSAEYNDLAHLIAPRDAYTGSVELQLARFTSVMLDQQFESGGDGMLFEYELVYYPTTTDDGTPQGLKLPQPDVVVGTPITDRGVDKEDYRYHFIIKSNRDLDDYQRLIAFARLFGQSDPDFLAQVGDVIDVDQWLRAFAFATLSGAVDQYGNNSQHNAQFYVRPADQRVLYFPHDLDFFSGSPYGQVVSNSDLARLLTSPTYARMFYAHLLDILQTTYNDSYMSYWRDHFGALLPDQSFANHHQFLVERADHVLNGAPDAVLNVFPSVAFTITSNGGQDFTVSTSTVTLQGEGWVDVSSIWRPGEPVALNIQWLSNTTWQATVSLVCGPNLLTLEARDRDNASVANTSITVSSTASGCP